MGEAALGVRLFSQSIFSPPADAPRLVTASPTIDLSAAVGGGNTVYIRRRGGEVVSKLTERNKTAQALAWKADGQFLAVAWSDGVVRLAGLESGKAVHQIRLFEKGDTPVPVTFLSWTRNFVGSQETWQDGNGISGRMLDGALGDGQHNREFLNLPRALLFLEIEDDLPKLQPLPVSGGSGDDMFVFSTHTSLEFMFPRLNPDQGDAVHIMVLGTADGRIHVSVYDTFVTGAFQVALPPRPGIELGGATQPLLRLRNHAAYPATTTHALLLACEEKDRRAVYLVPMDFVFVYASPLNLSLVAYKSTTFQKLLRYIKQTQVHMQGEWQTARELPARFLANIQEDLEGERRFKSIDHALRLTAVSGFVPPKVKQWLIETIGERGYKRWDKAVVTGLENLRDLLHENLMPALDRAMLALNRLRGLADFHRDDDAGFSPTQIAHLMDLVGCLILAGQSALTLVTAELELFVEFSTWLRSLIQRLAAPSQSEDLTDKELQWSIAPVLDYITNYLLTTPGDLHFGHISEEDRAADWAVVEACEGPLLDKLEEEMDKFDGRKAPLDVLARFKKRTREKATGGVYVPQQPGESKGKEPMRAETKGEADEADEADDDDDDDEDDGDDEDNEDNGDNGVDEPYMKALPTFTFLTALLSVHADRVFKKMAESGGRHVHFGPITRLSLGMTVHKSAVAMKAVHKTDPEDSADALVFSALTAKERRLHVYIFRSAISTSEGVSKATATQACAFALGASGNILDIRFLDAQVLFVLWSPASKERQPRLLAFSVQSSRIGYADYDGNRGEADPHQVPTFQLDVDGISPDGGVVVDGLCWVSGDLPEIQGGRDDRVDTHSPIARIEVLGPRRGGPVCTQEGSVEHGADGDVTSGARVCVMHADGTTYRVFSVSPFAEMFGSVS